MGEVVQFDPKKIEEAVSEEIKARFAGMVPAEAWRGLAKKHIDEFLTGSGPGTLAALVQAQLEAQVKRELETYFGNAGPWGWQWKDGQQVASREIERLVMENMPKIITSMISGAIQSVVSGMEMRVNRY